MMRGRVGEHRRKEKDKRGELGAKDQQCRGATRGIDGERRKVVLNELTSQAGEERKVRTG